MPFQFSTTSLRRLEELHPQLKLLCQTALNLNLMDFSIAVGHRGQAEQDEAHAKGNSQLKWPNSLHNKLPSLAVDLLPYPTGWTKKEPFYFLAGIMLSTASTLHIPICWGGDWNQNGNLFDQSFYDLAHFELQL